jgi:hypothetical protein
MIPFRFDEYVLIESDNKYLENNFLKPQECLIGKTYSDFYFKKPAKLKELMANAVTAYEKSKGKIQE